MKKFKIIFIVIALLLIGVFPAYGGMFDRGPSKERPAGRSKSSALMKAEKAFLRGDYEKAVNIANTHIKSRGKLDDELQYLAGRALLKLARLDEARNRFSRIINDSDSDKFLDKAYISLADSYYLEGDYKRAKSDYKKVMRYFPDSEDIPTVYYKLGECHSKLGEREASKKCYDELLRLYPASLEAKVLIGEKSDFVMHSVQLGSFTKWSNAKKLHDELRSKGFDVNIYTAVVGDSRFYRVRVGQYSRLSDAEDMARTLRNRGYSIKIYP